MHIKPSKIESASPLLYKNEKYNGVPVNAYEYDLREAYSQMLRLPLPDLNTARYDCRVTKDHVGFYSDGEVLRCTFEEGRMCQYVFQLVDSPYNKWLDRIDKKLSKATTPEEKLELKSIYRYAIGDLQNINPFIRCIVVERCNHLIEKYIDKNTVYCNTDSLVSTVERPDLANSGFEFVLKRENQVFKWQKDKMNYQWNNELPKYKGPKKRVIEYYNKTHERPWDILLDDVPESCKHKYNINKETLEVYEEE